MNDTDPLSRYHEIRRYSEGMRAAARDGDWERLIELERARAAIGKSLLDQGHGSAVGSADPSAKAALISSILASDEEIRKLVEPRRMELKTIFSSIDIEKKLQQHYAADW